MPQPAQRILSRDTLAGIGVLAISTAFCLGALGHRLGTLARMQAGYFPLLAGVIGVALGLALILSGLLSPPERTARPAVRPLLFLAAAFVLFSLLVDRAGLLPAVVACVTVSALADPKTRPHEALLLALGLAAGIWVLFILLLDRPITAIAGL